MISMCLRKKEGRWPAMIIVKEFWRHNKNTSHSSFMFFFGVATCLGMFLGYKGWTAPISILSEGGKSTPLIREPRSTGALYAATSPWIRALPAMSWGPRPNADAVSTAGFPQKMEVDGRYFSVQVGWILGSMLIFRGVTKTLFFLTSSSFVFFSVCFWINKWKSENDRSNKHD